MSGRQSYVGHDTSAQGESYPEEGPLWKRFSSPVHDLDGEDYQLCQVPYGANLWQKHEPA